jgi:UDPglucose 6-dehydrogenase
MRYSVVGLGKLGCSMAAAMASRGHDVIGYDSVHDVVDRVRAGEAPVEEHGLGELMSACRDRFAATHSLQEAVMASDLTFVVVPTPSDNRGAFVLDQALAAFHALGTALRWKREPHTVVLTSTVLPGSTRCVLIPALESVAGRRVVDELGVCYSPAFIALGSVIRDFLHPDLVLIGESHASAGEALAAAYCEIMPARPPLRRMSLENAELAKLAVNTFVTTKISFANMLADLCERLPGGDVDVVSDAVGLDRRIGRAYLTGALGYGGPCFPRDNQALSFLARALGSSAPLAEATDEVNRALPQRISERLRGVAQTHGTVAVLGLAYKPGTPVTEASQSLQIGLTLAGAGARVLAHDPLAGPTVRQEHGSRIEVVDDVAACIAVADVVLVASSDPFYADLSPTVFARNGGPRVVVDFWRILSPAVAAAEGVEYHAVGRGEAELDERHPLRALWGDGGLPPDLLRVHTASG